MIFTQTLPVLDFSDETQPDIGHHLFECLDLFYPSLKDSDLRVKLLSPQLESMQEGWNVSESIWNAVRLQIDQKKDFSAELGIGFEFLDSVEKEIMKMSLPSHSNNEVQDLDKTLQSIVMSFFLIGISRIEKEVVSSKNLLVNDQKLFLSIVQGLSNKFYFESPENYSEELEEVIKKSDHWETAVEMCKKKTDEIIKEKKLKTTPKYMSSVYILFNLLNQFHPKFQ